VEAATPEEATEIAQNRFKNGDQEDMLGNEWEKIERICDPQLMEPDPTDINRASREGRDI
jgi:hypothetical protein